MMISKKPLHLALRHKVVLQEKKLTADGAGGYTTLWQDVATLWAGITPMRGSEKFAAGQITAVVTHRFRVRYNHAIRTNMRFIFAGRSFNVQHVENIDERNVRLDVYTEEGGAV